MLQSRHSIHKEIRQNALLISIKNIKSFFPHSIHLYMVQVCSLFNNIKTLNTDCETLELIYKT